MYEERVKRLREKAGAFDYDGRPDIACDYEQAADAIEQLSNAGSAYGRGWTLGYDAGREESKLRWIPVTERLPDGRNDVLVYAGVLFSYITVGYYDGLWKFSFDDREIAGGVDYWMPLPEPPREE